MTSARLGQHFLKDERVLGHIAKQMELKGRTVLEIGAGHGELTKHLAKAARKVVALEKDPVLFAELSVNAEKLANVEAVNCDALEFGFSKYNYFAGNLPYEISSPLLFKAIGSRFEEAVFLLQKEFAQRLVAGPGTADWSRLSAMAQSRADIAIVGYVKPELFSPPPKVESAIVLLKRKKRPVQLDPQLVSLLFQHRNQSARKALEHSAKALGVSKQEARALAEKLPHSQKRGRELGLAELSEMSAAFRKARA